MLRINLEKLVIQAVVGEVAHPMARPSPYRISAEGKALVLPSVGSICYNVKIGDYINAFAGDHIEPGVSIKNREKGEGGSEPNFGLTLLACIGNSARVISGDSKGAIGYVTGKHGGIEHILVHFPLETLENLAIGDKIQIKACGLGMELLDFPLIKVMNIDPHLLNRIEIRQKGGKLQLPVTHIIPGKIMGSGLGKDNTYIGDYDIQMFDEGIVREYNLDTIRFGDMVLITDVDHTWGRIYREGAVTVGVVIHSACIQAGHGPGVTTIMTSKEGLIEPIMDAEANLKNWMG